MLHALRRSGETTAVESWLESMMEALTCCMQIDAAIQPDRARDDFLFQMIPTGSSNYSDTAARSSAALALISNPTDCAPDTETYCSTLAQLFRRATGKAHDSYEVVLF